MPRNLLIRRQFIGGPAASMAEHDCRPGSALQHRQRQESDEEPTPSECSSDSGRQSALPGEITLSPSASFERPSRLEVSGSSTLSSPSFSENLPSLFPSPLLMHPMGNMSFLPGIMENLAVSGNQREEMSIMQLQPHLSSAAILTEQLFHSPPALRSSTTGHLHRNHHSEANADKLTSSSQQSTVTTLQQLPSDAPFLSPASRKRCNSIGNATAPANVKQPKKTKNLRRIAFDDVTTSPVSGTVLRNVDDDIIVVRRGDVDKSMNIVEVTDEAKAQLQRIENKIGQYDCKLCKLTFGDAFALASHNCSRIVHIEYHCPECGKAFHCPANLASHRRWHKPKSATSATPKSVKKSAPVVLSPPPAKISPQESNNNPVELVKPQQSSVAKMPQSHVPFKKRFLFGKSQVKNHSDEPDNKNVNLDSISAVSAVTDEPHPLQVVSLDLSVSESQQHFHCQLCHTVVRGAQTFARHWQNCFAVASSTWSSILRTSKRS